MLRIRMILSCLLVGSLGFLFTPAWLQAQGVLDFSLDWVIGGRHSAYFLALEKGYYKAAGLDVKIHRGYGSADGVKRIASKRAAFAFTGASALILAQARNNVAAMYVAAIYSNAPHGLTYFGSKGIKTPKDLEGKKIGGTAFSTIRILFPAFAKVSGIDGSKVEWIQTDPASLPALLGAGKVDAIITYPMDREILSRKFGPMGRKVTGMQYADYGMQFYSNGITTSSERVRNKPKEVRGFVHATLRGLAAAFGNPEEAVDLMLKSNPSVSRAPAIPEVGIVRGLVLSEEALMYGVGTMLDEKMKVTRDIVLGAYNIKKQVDLKNVYTNKFLPKRGM